MSKKPKNKYKGIITIDDSKWKDVELAKYSFISNPKSYYEKARIELVGNQVEYYVHFFQRWDESPVEFSLHLRYTLLVVGEPITTLTKKYSERDVREITEEDFSEINENNLEKYFAKQIIDTQLIDLIYV
jgi:hypothetical protein